MAKEGLQLRSLVKASGELELSLAPTPTPDPAADEVVVRIEAAPINPSDLILLLGSADPLAIRQAGTSERPRAIGKIPPERLVSQKSRLDVALPVVGSLCS